jgi:hypothetical protein
MLRAEGLRSGDEIMDSSKKSSRGSASSWWCFDHRSRTGLLMSSLVLASVFRPLLRVLPIFDVVSDRFVVADSRDEIDSTARSCRAPTAKSLKWSDEMPHQEGRPNSGHRPPHLPAGRRLAGLEPTARASSCTPSRSSRARRLCRPDSANGGHEIASARRLMPASNAKDWRTGRPTHWRSAPMVW